MSRFFLFCFVAILIACAPSLAQRCEKAGMVWAEKRGEAGTIIGYECREKSR